MTKKILLSIFIMLSLVSSGIAQDRVSPALSSLVETERAFARTSVEKGIRESFLQFFAEDGIYFVPHPTKARAALLKRPALVGKSPITLNWEPIYADISNAGDLGYTLGPSTLTDHSPEKKPTRYGYFFSVWKKQADGSWKVVLDCGIDTPNHSNQTFVFQASRPSRSKSKSARSDLQAGRPVLTDLDRQFLKLSTAEGVLKAFVEFLADDARMHRNGALPFIGKNAIRSPLSKIEQFTWEPIASDISQSNELGYTYGSYLMKYDGVTAVERGYYVRVWKLDQKGKWKVMFDTLNPVPPEQP